MGGRHRTRLAASKAHQNFVKEAKRAVHTMGWEVSRDLLSPTLVGARPLFFPISPIFEAAFGYQGDLRFVQFGYTVASPHFGFSDGGDDLPSDQRLWSWFLTPLSVSPHTCRRTDIQPSMGSSRPKPEGLRLRRLLGEEQTFRPPIVCCWIDEIAGRIFLERDQTMMLFALAEPAEGDDHNVFVDGLLMSPGSENYKLPPDPELLTEFRRFLDSQVPRLTKCA